MVLEFDSDGLERRLKRLDGSHRALFACAVAERCITACASGIDTSGHPIDVTLLRDGLDAAWRAVEGKIREEALESLIVEVEDFAPDEASGEEWGESSASLQDAAIAISLALRCATSSKLSDAVESATAGYDAADYAANQRLDVDFNSDQAEVDLLASTEVQAELGAQLADLEMLETSQGQRVPIADTLETMRSGLSKPH
jgi:Protein of unknown function (DUF416)